ncbi:hypothetical protein LCGC14_1723380 [marine sediment metagenome]|uniref:Uncharacterized protein n=1 Tax=marine sediment metagenome TaxID=412755 RepID=A0A0F9KBF7_9ZZZZ
MLEKIRFYVEYAQAIIDYGQKVFKLISLVVKDWPVWNPPGRGLKTGVTEAISAD